MRYLTVEEVLSLHGKIIDQSGGGAGLRDRGALESAVAQPEMSFGGQDLYRTIVEKASALGHSLIQNHSFVDGNKRVGHAAMEVFLLLNGYEIKASDEEQEQVILSVASGQIGRAALSEWLNQHVVERRPSA
jgi:death-on-curing protein